MSDVDIGLVADIRFPGGTSTALANEIRAIRRLGLSCALTLADAGVLNRARPPHPELLSILNEEDVPVLSSGSDCACRLVLVHHPAVCAAPGRRRWPLRAPKVGLIAHHPAVMRDGTTTHDYAKSMDVLRDTFRCDPVILPVGPIVRDGFTALGGSFKLHDTDWPNLIDLERFTPRPARDVSAPMQIGRHSRPDVDKWPTPDDAHLVYPERDDIEFRMLGVSDQIREMFHPWPAHWQGLPFRVGAALEFLQGLDAYSYFHAPHWVEAFGYNILEALACGLPTVLPPHFRRTFGDGPLYASSPQATQVYDRLIADPDFRAEAGRAARNAAFPFGLDRMEERLSRLLDPVPVARGRVAPPRRPDTTLVVTSNGIGAGHIMRQIAVARVAPVDLNTVFFTLSEAAGFAQKAGFLAESRPFHRGLGIDVGAWNVWFHGQLAEALDFYRPDSVIFDGNMPYSGFLAALQEHHTGTAIWMRRGLWRVPDQEAANRSHAFDLILEPGELAHSADPGHAGRASAPYVTLPVVLPVQPSQRLSRETARRLLNLPDGAPSILLALGAGRNRDVAQVRTRVFDAFEQAQVVELVNPLAPEPSSSPHTGHLQRQIFPLAQFLAAFDGAVLAAGYNSFHEIIAAGVPALFLPNVAPEMDLQECRADFAAARGWALSARADRLFALDRGLDALADASVRSSLREACARIEADWSGAEQAARLISLATRRSRPGLT